MKIKGFLGEMSKKSTYYQIFWKMLQSFFCKVKDRLFCWIEIHLGCPCSCCSPTPMRTYQMPKTWSIRYQIPLISYQISDISDTQFYLSDPWFLINQIPLYKFCDSHNQTYQIPNTTCITEPIPDISDSQCLTYQIPITGHIRYPIPGVSDNQFLTYQITNTWRIR